MIEHVDPFIGSSATDLPLPHGLGLRPRWWPKPQVGDTHPARPSRSAWCRRARTPGPTPPATGCYQWNTQGVPTELHDRLCSHPASPTSSSSGDRGHPEVLQLLPGDPDAGAAGLPGRHLGSAGRGGRARLLRVHPQFRHPLRSARLVRAALSTATPPGPPDARSWSTARMGGLAIPYGSTVPLRSHLKSVGPGVAQARDGREGGRWPSTWSATPVIGGSCCGMTGG